MIPMTWLPARRASLLLLLLFVFTPTGARAASDLTYVIPPGQEALLQTMLGVESGVTGGWTFASADVARSQVRATYRRAAGESLVIALRHPDGADGAGRRVAAFAILIEEGPEAAAAQLLDALAASIDRHGSAWRWVAVGAGSKPASPDPTRGEGARGLFTLVDKARGALRDEDAAGARRFIAELLAQESAIARRIDKAWMHLEVGFLFVEMARKEEASRAFERALSLADEALGAVRADCPRCAFPLKVMQLRARIGLGKRSGADRVQEIQALATDDQRACQLFDLARDLLSVRDGEGAGALVRALATDRTVCRRALYQIGQVAAATRDYEGLTEILAAGAERFPDDKDLAAVVLGATKQRPEDVPARPPASAPAAPRATSGAAPGGPATSQPSITAPDRPWVPTQAQGSASVHLSLWLILLFLLSLPLALFQSARDLAGSGDARFNQTLLAIVGLGLLLRLLVPHDLVMHYMGYWVTQLAATFEELPKYGPSAFVLYHVLFKFVAPSHHAIMTLNSVLAGLTPFVAAWILLQLGLTRLTALAGAALLAFLPLFVKDANSETILVPTILWTLLGLGATLAFLRTGRWWLLLIGLINLVLAMMARPEALLLAPLTVAALAAFAWPERPRVPLLVAAGIVLMAVLSFRGMELSTQMTDQFDRGNTTHLLAGWRVLAGMYLWEGLITKNGALWPSIFPLSVTLLAVFSFFGAAGRARWISLALAGLGLLWIMASRTDLPFVSVARIQVPGMLLLTLSAAIGVEALWSHQEARLEAGPRRTVLLAFQLLLLALNLVATVPALWVRTNAHDEEALLEDGLAALPAEPAVILYRAWGAEPREKGHHQMPKYAFEPPWRRDQLWNIPEWLDGLRPSRPTYALLGTRCYMRNCDARGQHPACAAIRAGFELQPVIERHVPTRGFPMPGFHQEPVTHPDMVQDLDFPWCLPRDGMVIGLYRVLGPRG
jgi:hypothetical protein